MPVVERMVGRTDTITLPSPGTLKGEDLNSPSILPRPTDLQPVDSEATSRDHIPDEGPGAWNDGKTEFPTQSIMQSDNNQLRIQEPPH